MTTFAFLHPLYPHPPQTICLAIEIESISLHNLQTENNHFIRLNGEWKINV